MNSGSLPSVFTNALSWREIHVHEACGRLSALRAAKALSFLKRCGAKVEPISPKVATRLLRAPALFEQLRVVTDSRRVDQLIESELTYLLALPSSTFQGWTALGDAWMGAALPPIKHLMTNLNGFVWTSPVIGLGIPVDLSAGATCCYPKASQHGDSWPDTVLEDVAKCAAAIDLIAAASVNVATFVGVFTSNVILYRDSRQNGLRSATSPASIGRTVLVNTHKSTIPELAEALVHESIHSAISIVELAEPLHSTSFGALQSVRSPWTGQLLPHHAALHAVLVWAGLEGFYRLLSHSYPLLVGDRLREIRKGFKVLLCENTLATLMRSVSPAWHGELQKVVEYASKR